MTAIVFSSYRSLARFEEEITPDHTGSLVDTIRFRRRDALTQARHEKRAERVRSLRRSFDLAEHIVQGGDDYYNDCWSNDPANSSFTDTPCSWETADSKYEWSYPNPDTCESIPNWPSPAESPVYSTCSTPTTVCADEIDGPIARGISEQMIKKSQQIRKQAPKQSVKNYRRKRPLEKHSMQLYDQDGINRDYELFCKIDQSTAKNLNALAYELNSNWRLILRPIFSHNENIRTEVLHRLTLRMSQNLIAPETLLNLLSHGLMHGLGRILADKDGPRRVVNFIIAVQQTAPMVFPYLVDMASVARFFKTFAEIAQLNAELDLDSLLTFYETILPIFIKKIIHGSQDSIIIPGLSSTHSNLSDVTLNYYGPMSTAIKTISPATIETLANTLAVDFTEPRVVSKVLRVLTNIAEVTYLQLIQRTGNVFTVFPLLEAFRRLKFEDSLSFLISYYTNQRQTTTSQSTIHSTQLLAQFQAFYGECSHAFRQFHDQYRIHTGMQL